MSDYYHHFLHTMSVVGGNQVGSPPELHPQVISGVPGVPGMPIAMGPAPMGAPMGAPQMGRPYSNVGYYSGYSDPMAAYSAPQKSSQRGRRKSASGMEAATAVKHRRTRSGCFMCRSRRVKCDESRPICERCKKGNRECVYPDPPAPKGSAGQSSSSKEPPPARHTSPGSSNEDEDEGADPDAKLEPILDEDEELDEPLAQDLTQSPVRRSSPATSPIAFSGDHRGGSETPSLDRPSPASPATTVSIPAAKFHVNDPTLQAGSSRSDWSNLPGDFQYYLTHYCENITSFHYCMVVDPDNFYPVILPNIALRDEALLHAVVGFSAYNLTLRNPEGKIQDFLKYYNKSVILLLNFLKKKEKPTVATLLTILQLATIEEYLGDWVNLMGHQKAAFEIMTKLFTPEEAMESPTGRMIMAWYSRFDVFVALMGGFRTSLPREWFTIFVDFCRNQIAASGDNLLWKLEEASATLRLISRDMSILFAKDGRGQISPEEFAAEHGRLIQTLNDWKDGMDPAITDPAYLVTDFSYQRPLDENDIINPYIPGILYKSPLFATTALIAEWHSIFILHICQASTMPREVMYATMGGSAYAICQIFEAVERWPGKPKGGLILCQACLAISALFLPQDQKHHNWIRRKFAVIETMGYIHPITLRSKMAEVFCDPSCVRWWLPNDEGYSPILQSIRTFADERNAAAVNAQAENLREVRHIFAKMALDSPDDGGGHGQGKGKDVEAYGGAH